MRLLPVFPFCPWVCLFRLLVLAMAPCSSVSLWLSLGVALEGSHARLRSTHTTPGAT